MKKGIGSTFRSTTRVLKWIFVTIQKGRHFEVFDPSPQKLMEISKTWPLVKLFNKHLKLDLRFLFGVCIGLFSMAILQLGTQTNVCTISKAVEMMKLEVGSDCGQSCEEGADGALAKTMYERVRVACWIMTSPDSLAKKAIHVKNTWTRRCNLRLFMSSVTNSSFPTIGLNVSEGRQHLTAKTMKAFKYLYDHYLDDADWFLKADDDTYVILENLRYFLSGQDPESPVYFGQRFKRYVKSGYASGGAGYVISKEALRRFGTKGLRDPKLCVRDRGPEDVKFGQCMERLGVKLQSSLDSHKRSRFHYDPPGRYIIGYHNDTIHQEYNQEGGVGGVANMSVYAISFHRISGDQMYALDYFIYYLRPYGILNLPLNLNVEPQQQEQR